MSDLVIREVKPGRVWTFSRCGLLHAVATPILRVRILTDDAIQAVPSGTVYSIRWKEYCYQGEPHAELAYSLRANSHLQLNDGSVWLLASTKADEETINTIKSIGPVKYVFARKYRDGSMS